MRGCRWSVCKHTKVECMHTAHRIKICEAPEVHAVALPLNRLLHHAAVAAAVAVPAPPRVTHKCHLNRARGVLDVDASPVVEVRVAGGVGGEDVEGVEGGGGAVVGAAAKGSLMERVRQQERARNCGYNACLNARWCMFHPSQGLTPHLRPRPVPAQGRCPSPPLQMNNPLPSVLPPPRPHVEGCG